jgi:uncharacterized protein YecT (DUF1311 family)
MRRINPAILAAVAVGLLLLIAAVAMMTRPKTAPQDKLSDAQAAGAGASAPAKRCASQATYDRIKLEIFRQAGQVRTSDQSIFDKLAAYASVRVERPLLRSHDDELGTVRCTGRLTIDLPPGVAVVGGRRALSADVDYVLQPAADASGDVVMLEGADPIIVPLATLARSGGGAPLPAPPTLQADVGNARSAAQSQPVPIPSPEPRAPAPEPRAPVAEPRPEPRSQATAGNARPSFNCRYARTRGEIAVCRDSGLAALDRQMASQFYRALRQADRGQRARLTSTRDSFLRFRDRCPSDSCIAETYRGRMREIGDIMSGDWQPRR